VRPSHIAVLVVLSVIWGSAFALVKVALEEVPPLTLVAGRLAGAALFLASHPPVLRSLLGDTPRPPAAGLRPSALPFFSTC